jgi:hypothetical protein
MSNWEENNEKIAEYKRVLEKKEKIIIIIIFI